MRYAVLWLRKQDSHTACLERMLRSEGVPLQICFLILRRHQHRAEALRERIEVQPPSYDLERISMDHTYAVCRHPQSKRAEANAKSGMAQGTLKFRFAKPHPRSQSPAVQRGRLGRSFAGWAWTACSGYRVSLGSALPVAPSSFAQSWGTPFLCLLRGV